ncbi:hypothetical protein ACSNOK_02365 [Streptomyces sp. URMC 126]|uniref:hypothetical protein n=1 Tax=Streptomyces sp. URMC 126 TaxID=3423401 RepID=UPI003F1C6F25
MWLLPDAVRPRPRPDGSLRPAADWQALAEEQPGPPPLHPAGWWDPHWEIAAGAVLAHLLVASQGSPVIFPDGLLTEMFDRALTALLAPDKARSPAKRAVPAGPGLPAFGADIALVPRHPVTDEAWRPPGHDGARPLTVSLLSWMWTHLTRPRSDRLPVPATGGLPREALLDFPPPPRPWRLFGPETDAFLHTLARLPAVKEPWLRAIYDRVRGRRYGGLFTTAAG